MGIREADLRRVPDDPKAGACAFACAGAGPHGKHRIDSILPSSDGDDRAKLHPQTAVLCLIMLGYQAARSQHQATPEDRLRPKVAAATYEHLATAIIEIEATEDELVKSILIGYHTAAQGHLRAAVRDAEGRDRHLEAAAAEVANIANEGDKRIQAVRQRLAKAGHTHNTDVETKADYMFITNREKKGLLDLATKIARPRDAKAPTWRLSAPNSPPCSRRRSPPSDPIGQPAAMQNRDMQRSIDPGGGPVIRAGLVQPADAGRRRMGAAFAGHQRPRTRPSVRRRRRSAGADAGALQRRAGQGSHPGVGRYRGGRSSTSTATASLTSSWSTPGR